MISEMKINDLKALAKQKGIKGADGMNKATLIEVLSKLETKPEVKPEVKIEDSQESENKDPKPKKSKIEKVPGKYKKFQ